MLPMRPAVSVVLPVRNGMPYLPLAVESVLGQTVRDLELVVVDDCSTDDTRAYLASLADPRVRVVPSRGVGIAAALNTGLALARAPYLARQDADDISAPERLARQTVVLDRSPRVAVVATCADYIDADGHPVEDAWTDTVRRQHDPAQTPDQIRGMLPLTCCLTHGSVVMRTDVLRSCGGYDAAMVPAEDYDLWLRLLAAHDFVKLPDRLYRYRVHPTQSGAIRRTEQTARVIAAKLRFLRREVPGLGVPTRLVLPCDDRGAALFRAVAPAEGYEPVLGDDRGAPGLGEVVVVTDFAALPRYASALAPTGCLQFGNMFVRRPAAA
jgi:glycosyltransferase involved in cell wall biosynthesis